MIYLLLFIILFFSIFIIYDIFVIRKEKALNKMKTSKDMLLLCKIGKINIENIDLKLISKYLCLCNSFIISLVCTFVIFLSKFIKNFYIWILVSSLLSMVLLIPLILLLYKFIGKKIKKEGR